MPLLKPWAWDNLIPSIRFLRLAQPDGLRCCAMRRFTDALRGMTALLTGAPKARRPGDKAINVEASMKRPAKGRYGAIVRTVDKGEIMVLRSVFDGQRYVEDTARGPRTVKDGDDAGLVRLIREALGLVLAR